MTGAVSVQRHPVAERPRRGGTVLGGCEQRKRDQVGRLRPALARHGADPDSEGDPATRRLRLAGADHGLPGCGPEIPESKFLPGVAPREKTAAASESSATAAITGRPSALATSCDRYGWPSPTTDDRRIRPVVVLADASPRVSELRPKPGGWCASGAPSGRRTPGLVPGIRPSPSGRHRRSRPARARRGSASASRAGPQVTKPGRLRMRARAGDVATRWIHRTAGQRRATRRPRRPATERAR